jgi:predicted ATPase with chaperone activity
MKKVYSGSFEGIIAKSVSVETSFTKGLPSFSIVGLGNASEQFGLSFRSVNKVLKVSRTVADLSNSKEIKKEHLLEALSYRRR